MRLPCCLLFLWLAFAGEPQIQFEEVAHRAGLLFQVKNAAAGRFRQVELMPGGLAAFDYDNDADPDLFFTNGAALPSMRKTGPEFHNRLFRNNGDLTFTDVTTSAGVAGEGYSMAAAAADYDNNGYVDIFVAGVNRNLLYRNRGDGSFLDVTQKAGLSGIDRKYGKMWAISAGWFDYDNDGLLDLFVSNYVAWDPRTEGACGPPENRLYCHPDNYQGLPNQLFRNNGDGTFTDVSAPSGIASSIGKGMGLAFADYNRDGFVDVFVANDSVRNFLFQNRGDGTFREVGLEAGAALADHGNAIAGMGADFRDANNDGLPDIVVTGMVNDTYLLFRNNGRGFFDDDTVSSGLAIPTAQLTGWAAGMIDFDNDGWKDVFFANSHFPQLNRYLGSNSELPNSVFRNIGAGRFRDVSKSAGSGFQERALHRGAAFADFDGDGRMDVAVTALNSPVKLFRNTTTPAGHWIALRLVGSKSSRDGLGAEVRLFLQDGRTLHNHATTSVGYASSSVPFVYFGLGSERVVKRIEIRWPGRSTQTLENVEGDRVVVIKES